MSINQHDAGSARRDGELIAYVIRHLTCGDCGESYGVDDVQVMLHADFQWDLVATCPVCAADRVVTAYDFPPYERLRARMVPLTRDDVREWRVFLAAHAGDMHDLIDCD